MKDRQRCLNCREYNNCKDSFTSWIFFIIGLIATVAIRVVTVLIDVKPVYGKVAWYVGVGGFFAFFVYKFKVNQNRAKLIRQQSLVDKLAQQKQLSEEELDLGFMFLEQMSKKETDPEKLKDDTRERLEQIIEDKLMGKEVKEVPVKKPASKKEPDLADLLRKSIALEEEK